MTDKSATPTNSEKLPPEGFTVSSDAVPYSFRRLVDWAMVGQYNGVAKGACLKMYKDGGFEWFPKGMPTEATQAAEIARLRELMERSAKSLERNLYRQSEKLEWIAPAFRAALSSQTAE